MHSLESFSELAAQFPCFFQLCGLFGKIRDNLRSYFRPGAEKSVNGPGLASFTIPADEATRRALGRHRSETVYLIVLEKCLNVFHNRVSASAAYPDRDSGFARNSLALTVAELIKPFKEIMRQAIQHGEVGCSADHVCVSLCNLAAQFIHVVLNLADIILDAFKACYAWCDLPAGKRYKLGLNTDCAQDLLNQPVCVAVLPWTTRYA